MYTGVIEGESQICQVVQHKSQLRADFEIPKKVPIFGKKQNSKIPKLLLFFGVNLQMNGKIPKKLLNFGISGGADLRTAAHLNPNHNIKIIRSNDLENMLK